MKIVRSFFLILIALMGVNSAFAADCQEGEPLVLTSPRAGARTLNDGVTVRGYLCDNFALIEVRNETTHKASTVVTTEVCSKRQCTYHFAAPMRSLALGTNHIKAMIPGEDIEVEVEIVRSAWVGILNVFASG